MDGAPAAFCLSLHLRRDFRVQHSYCFSLCSFMSPPKVDRVFATYVQPLSGWCLASRTCTERAWKPNRLEFILE